MKKNDSSKRQQQICDAEGDDIDEAGEGGGCAKSGLWYCMGLRVVRGSVFRKGPNEERSRLWRV